MAGKKKPKKAVAAPRRKWPGAFIRFSGHLRDSASAASDPTKADWLHTVADAAAAVGRELQKIRA